MWTLLTPLMLVGHTSENWPGACSQATSFPLNLHSKWSIGGGLSWVLFLEPEAWDWYKSDHNSAHYFSVNVSEVSDYEAHLISYLGRHQQQQQLQWWRLQRELHLRLQRCRSGCRCQCWWEPKKQHSQVSQLIHMSRAGSAKWHTPLWNYTIVDSVCHFHFDCHRQPHKD